MNEPAPMVQWRLSWRSRVQVPAVHRVLNFVTVRVGQITGPPQLREKKEYIATMTNKYHPATGSIVNKISRCLLVLALSTKIAYSRNTKNSIYLIIILI